MIQLIMELARTQMELQQTLTEMLVMHTLSIQNIVELILMTKTSSQIPCAAPAVVAKQETIPTRLQPNQPASMMQPHHSSALTSGLMTSNSLSEIASWTVQLSSMTSMVKLNTPMSSTTEDAATDR